MSSIQELYVVETSSGAGGSGIKGEVNNFVDLNAIVNPLAEDVYWVKAKTGTSLLLNSKKKGLYKYNGTTWEYIGDGIQTINENDMSTNSTSFVPTQSSVRAFVQSQVAKTFEHYATNKMCYNETINYTNGNITSVNYTNNTDTITKTINYTNGNLASVVLSGDVPSGIALTKTIVYTNGNITNITYT